MARSAVREPGYSTYGFIRHPSFPNDISIHASDLSGGADIDDLNAGVLVSFRVAEGDRGTCARGGVTPGLTPDKMQEGPPGPENADTGSGIADESAFQKGRPGYRGLGMDALCGSKRDAPERVRDLHGDLPDEASARKASAHRHAESGDGRQCRPQVRSNADRPDLWDAGDQPSPATGAQSEPYRRLTVARAMCIRLRRTAGARPSGRSRH